MTYLSQVNLLNRYKKLSVVEQVTLFLFVAFVVLTAVCNRLSIDDLFFKYRIDTVGLGGIIDGQYSRVMAYFLNGCIIATNNQVVLVLYNLVSIFVFAYFLIRVLPSFLPAAFKGKNKFAFLFFLFFFCCCSKPAEVFFWYTQVSTYLWCINCILIVVFFLQKGFRHNWQIPMFWLACLFIGSSSEFLALQFLALLLVYSLWKRPVFSREGRIIYLIGFSLLLISLAITLFSPGLEARNNLLARGNFGTMLVSHNKFFLLYFAGYFKIQRLSFLAIFFVGFISYGNRSGSTSRTNAKEWIAFMVFVFLSLLITSYKLRDIAPPRALIICDLIGLFLLAKAGLQIGSALRTKKNLRFNISNVTAIAVSILFLVHSCMHVFYAMAYNRREQVIASDSSTLVIVKRLPECYFIQSCNIGRDKDDFRNQHLKLSHGSKKDIVEGWSGHFENPYF